MGCCASSSIIPTTIAEQNKALQDADKGEMEMLRLTMNQQEPSHHRSTLHWACMKNNVKALTFLLDNGANLMLRNKDNFTCLHEAAHNCSYECIELLLDRGSLPVEITASYKFGKDVTPLQLLVTQIGSTPKPNELRAKCIQLLRDRGADPKKMFTVINAQGKRFIFSAESHGFYQFKGENRVLLEALASKEQQAIMVANRKAAETKAQATKVFIDEYYVKFVADAAERTMRIVLRVKNIPLTEDAQIALKAQIITELGDLPAICTNIEEVRTRNLTSLAALLADEIVLMVDAEGRVEAGVMKTAAAAHYKQILDAAKEKAAANSEKNAAAAAAAGVAAAGAGSSKGDTMNPLAEKAVDAAGEMAANQAIDAITGLIPLPFAGAILGAGVKMAVKKTASAAVSAKN